MFYSVSLFSQAPLACGSRALPSVLFEFRRSTPRGLSKGDLLLLSIQQLYCYSRLFQLHGGIISHMLVLATPSSTVHNTKYLDPYHWSHIRFSCLLLRQWCRDVASGADRHLDITFGLQEIERFSPVFVLFREAFNHPYISFFHLQVNGFSVTCFRTFWGNPLPTFN